MAEKLEIRAEKVFYRNVIDFVAVMPGRVGVEIIMDPHDQAKVIDRPTFSLEHAEAQVLMDDLWRAGLRPSEGSGSAGAMAATERHLRDMQTIAFKSLKIDKADR